MDEKDHRQTVEAKPEPEQEQRVGMVPHLSFREQLQQNIKSLENQRDALMAQINGTIGALNASQQLLALYDKEQAGAGEGKT